MDQNAQIVYEGIPENSQYEEIINKVVEECFKTEKLLDKGIYVSITLTNPDVIWDINKTYRNVDRPTDVLSFPMFEKDEIDSIKNDVLGDIVISIKQVEIQAQEYGHSFERELAYMVVHGFYHLMGYDHMEEAEKAQMREKEEAVLSKIGLERE